FDIKDKVFSDLFLDSMKMFYFQRCGIELEEKYAGVYRHKACHTAKSSLLKNPSVSFDCCGGWHDAGDYGKYVTAGSVAVAHLLYAYDISPEVFTESLNIPESGNGVPDILNECRYELEWFLKMQTEDGGVYHKCTSMHHTGFVMPEDDPLPFFVTPVSSLATADFAAICALASRIYKKFDEAFAEILSRAAQKAYKWLVANPAYDFTNPKECTTGTYEDPCDTDERLWAYAELYRLTGDEQCIALINSALNVQISTTALGWGDVGGLAALAVLTAPEGIFNDDLTFHFRQNWLDEADKLTKISKENAFGIAFYSFHFGWGSNMGVLLNSMILSFAHRLTGNEDYLKAAICQIDYILGRNAMDTSYVTGYGEKAFRDPHNRPTYADGIDDPIPGYVSGGPNRNPCDPAALEAIKPGSAPMKCYVDNWGSYSTNEITIYWNSPLVFTLAYFIKTIG
ncbi:MAG: glycoside hydrolase family 9 protein, partial [Lachnospiraceae bacterium]